ncbi:neutral/alkaline non-lysosomal ceramidase N-terminal domain-containing protein [Natrononativus amylolyticus]|uniref:neutral/alkaline non-lysosomal ceramidase N-terminal domain-containing protein n=1 Tax=Natrononativus amylolyticus TaxID=2963434 RepID=UPI0020CF1860|nr:neutral/alkaline non-lysosomal ceramidase N-terminal domain-containing protein [Natrononativus amylolyticus]
MPAHEARLRAGSASTDITPEEPVVMSGYGAREGRSTGVHDPLFAAALVLDDGTSTVGVASVDVLNVSREFTNRVRTALASAGVDLDSIVVAATHTHAGPYLPARALDVSPPLRATADVSETVSRIEEAVVETFRRAHAALEPAAVHTATDSEGAVQENRRAAGGVGGNVRVPHGPVDPNVTAVLVETVSGAETVLYNFACHPVCATARETHLSADWPGVARERVREVRPGATVLFLNGAAGDVNPAGLRPGRSRAEAYEAMERVGGRVGDAVVRALEGAEPAADGASRAPIFVDEAELRLPVKRTPPVETLEARIDDLDDRIERLEADGETVGAEKLAWDRQYATELLAIARWDATCLPNRLPYFEIGTIGVLGMPGEVHTAHGLRFKSAARAESLLLAGYANDYVGYLPPLADLENVGYEVRTAKLSPEAVLEFRREALGLVGALTSSPSAADGGQ